MLQNSDVLPSTPLARSELLQWLNAILPETTPNGQVVTPFRRVEQCGNGVPYVLLLPSLLPIAYPLLTSKLKFPANHDFEAVTNLKLIQDALQRNGIPKPDVLVGDTTKLIKGNFQANLSLLQWFYGLYTSFKESSVGKAGQRQAFLEQPHSVCLARGGSKVRNPISGEAKEPRELNCSGKIQVDTRTNCTIPQIEAAASAMVDPREAPLTNQPQDCQGIQPLQLHRKLPTKSVVQLTSLHEKSKVVTRNRSVAKTEDKTSSRLSQKASGKSTNLRNTSMDSSRLTDIAASRLFSSGKARSGSCSLNLRKPNSLVVSHTSSKNSPARQCVQPVRLGASLSPRGSASFDDKMHTECQHQCIGNNRDGETSTEIRRTSKRPTLNCEPAANQLAPSPTPACVPNGGGALTESGAGDGKVHKQLANDCHALTRGPASAWLCPAESCATQSMGIHNKAVIIPPAAESMEQQLQEVSLERHFYYDKLRMIENLVLKELQADNPLTCTFARCIRNILYATE